MNRRGLLFGGAALGAMASLPAMARVAAPVTPRRPVRISQLGRERIDPYAWLKPANWKEVWRDPSVLDPKILAWLKRENAYCDAELAPTRGLQATLARRMRARLAPDAETPPMQIGDFAYRTRFAPGAQYPQHLRRRLPDGPEEVLLDEPARRAGHGFYRAIDAGPTPDQRYFVWAEDVTGAEKYVIQVKDLATGEIKAGPADAFGTFAVTPDSAWLFWTWRDASSRPRRIYRRPLTGGPDVLVYEETDPGFLLTVEASNSGRFLQIRAWNDVTSEVRLIDASRPDQLSAPLSPRESGHLYSVEDWGAELVILTNSGRALDFKLMRAPIEAPQRANWRDWIGETRGRTLVEIRAFADHLARVERVEGNRAVVIRDRQDRDLRVAMEEPAYVLKLEPSPYASGALRITYESPRTPPTWMSVDLRTGRRTRLAAQATPNYDPALYVVRRIRAPAADGALVPITLLHRKDLPPGARAPLLLTGYGSYGADFETGFSIANLALVDQGFVWAAAHVRGGSEKGRAWFEAARALKKKVSFSDFLSCADHLVAERLTGAGRIVLYGFSAGGLMTGVALNERPELFGACIGQAPFVDMLNTMSDATHPLVPLTRPVWGDPLSDPKAYDYIASYSPYENVRRQPYPPVLATTAVGDDRVGFWEPAKWIAALRAKSTSGAPMLLHTELRGAHVGRAGRFDEIEDEARMYAFAAWAVGRGRRGI